MKATITSHFAEGGKPEMHRFGFVIEDGLNTPFAESITLRTARLLVGQLVGDTAFVLMLRVIIATLPGDYDSLVGRVFTE